MKKETSEELMVKWMDDELSPAEAEQFAALVKERPDLEEELRGIKEVARKVGASVPASVDPPYGDFFNSQLMRKVDLEIGARRPVQKVERWWESLRWAWAPAGALTLVLSFFAGHRIGQPESREVAAGKARPVQTEAMILPTVYSAGDSLEAEVIANAEGEVAAIVVNGISAISDEVDFATVTSHVDLPEDYLTAEARRFD
jgi:anti-sigma factor RsiW